MGLDAWVAVNSTSKANEECTAEGDCIFLDNCASLWRDRGATLNIFSGGCVTKIFVLCFSVWLCSSALWKKSSISKYER